MNILLIHPQKEISDLLTFPLESSFAANIFCATTLAEYQQILTDKKVVPDVIIAQNSKEMIDPLLVMLRAGENPANLILCDGTHVSDGAALQGINLWGFAARNTLLADLMDKIQEKHPVVQPVKSGDDDKYCRINTSLLLKMNPLSADIFIRLSATHYIKMFNRDDVFDLNDLQRYRDQKKVDYLYLLEADCRLFVGKLSSELEKLLQMEPSPTVQQVSEFMDGAVETTQALIAKFGVTPEIEKAVKDSVSVTLKAMGDFPQLGDILKNLTQNQGKYIGRHSMLLGNIACSMAVCMDWISEATFEKLTMAAFLHDAPLQDQELCAVKNVEEFDKKYKGKFNLAQVQEYKAHPQRAANLLGNFKDAPAETDKIILQHHEHPMGSGFPGQLTGNYISPLGALFIIAHDLTDYVIDNGALDMEAFLTEYQKKYSTGNFKKIARSIASATL